MTRRRNVFGRALVLPRCLGIGALLAFAACQGEPHYIVVFHTSSLSPLLQTVSRRFEANNPDVAIRGEAAGSLDSLAKVTDLGRACDLLAIADHRLIARLLMPDLTQIGYEFLGNELVLAASERRLFEPLTRQPRRPQGLVRTPYRRKPLLWGRRSRSGSGRLLHAAVVEAS